MERGEGAEKTGISITEMPDKETLEAFLEGQVGSPVRVYFNIETGRFEWPQRERHAQPTQNNTR